MRQETGDKGVGGVEFAVELCLLGPVRIAMATEATIASHFGGAQVAKAAAFLLLAEGGWVSRERLAEAVWAETVPASWQPALRNVVSKVRTWLGAAGLDGTSVLRAGNGGWALVPPATATFDLIESHRMVQLAESALAQGSPERARRLAGSAAEVLGRPLATEIDAPWIDQVRHETLQWRLRALDVGADGCLALGKWPSAAAAAGTAIELDPYREASHRRLITAHDRAGHRGEALRAYERCRRRLAEDLGVNPAPETEMTYLKVLDPGAAAVAPRPDPPKALAAPALPETGRTVGRDDELARIGRLDRVARFARRQVVIVRGAAGVGKTHVALRFAEMQVVAGRTVVFGRAPRTKVPYGAFADALSRYSRSLDPAALREVLGWTAPVLANVIGAPAANEPGQLDHPAKPEITPADYHEAFMDAFHRLTGLGPVLLIVDDLDHCDDTSVDLLQRLCERNLPGLLVVGTIRSGEPVPAALEDFLELLAREGGLHQFELDPLTREAVAALAADRLGISQADPSLVQLLMSQADGSPLLTTQLLELLTESSALDPVSGLLNGALVAGLGLPRGTSDVVRRRLRRLDPVALRVAHLVAIYGDEMPIHILQDLAADGVEFLLDAIDLLCSADFLAVDTDRPGSLRFRHALIASAVREDLGVTRRAHLHRSIGLHLLDLTGQGEPLAALAVEHLVQAGELSPADARCRARLEAGRRALAVSALGESIEHLGAALDDLDAVALQVQADVWCTLGDAHRTRFELEPATEAYHRALDLARALGDDRILVRTIDGLACGGGVGEPIEPDLETRWDLLREGLAAVGDGDSVERIRLLANYALARYGESDVRATEEAAVAMAQRLRTADAFAAGLSALRQLQSGPAHIEDRRRYMDQLVALHGPHLPGEVAVRVEQGRLQDAIELGNREDTDRALGALSEYAEGLGRPFQRWWVATWKVTVAIIDGDLALAERRADAARDQAMDPTDDINEMVYGASILGIRLLRGNPRELVGPLTAAIGSGWDIPVFRAALACVQARGGDLVAASKGYDRLVDQNLARTPSGNEWSICVYFLAHLAQLLNDVEGGQALAARLAPFARTMMVTCSFATAGGPFFGSISHLLGDLAALAGDWTDACRNFEVALADHRSFRAPIFAALSAHSLGVALERSGGDRERAAVLRTEAHRRAVQLGIVLRDPGTGQVSEANSEGVLVVER